MRVEAVTADRRDFMRFLSEDPVRNAFALYDLEEEGDRVQCFAAVEGDAFRGYLLAWHGRQYPNVIITGDKGAAEALLPRAPPSPCTFLLVPGLVAAVEERREIRARRMMDFMFVEARSFRSADTQDAERLGEKDADALEALYRDATEEPREWGQWAERGLAYGLSRRNQLVAAAGTHFIAPGCSLIGGVYTPPDFRRQGYAAAVTSAVTEDALRRSDRVGLMVVSTNVAAIGLYEKLGYRKGVQWAWLDSGTGHIPLA
ncbi:MAG: GNAT family N-acetyltransferase [Candidatus Thermoplasmatota archaeon]|nr:GNAT family N-acetyltransferase [Candidatus Thermoplasmatota archaeon]